MDLATLHSFEHNTNMTVGDVLCAFYGASDLNVLSKLENNYNGIMDYWARCNGCSQAFLLDCIDYAFNDKLDSCDNSFKITDNKCELNLYNKIKLDMHWLIDE